MANKSYGHPTRHEEMAGRQNDGAKVGVMHVGEAEPGSRSGVPISASEVDKPSGLEHRLGSEPSHG